MHLILELVHKVLLVSCLHRARDRINHSIINYKVLILSGMVSFLTAREHFHVSVAFSGEALPTV